MERPHKRAKLQYCWFSLLCSDAVARIATFLSRKWLANALVAFTDHSRVIAAEILAVLPVGNARFVKIPSEYHQFIRHAVCDGDNIKAAVESKVVEPFNLVVWAAPEIDVPSTVIRLRIINVPSVKEITLTGEVDNLQMLRMARGCITNELPHLRVLYIAGVRAPVTVRSGAKLMKFSLRRGKIRVNRLSKTVVSVLGKEVRIGQSNPHIKAFMLCYPPGPNTFPNATVAGVKLNSSRQWQALESLYNVTTLVIAGHTIDHRFWHFLPANIHTIVFNGRPRCVVDAAFIPRTVKNVAE